MLIRIRDKMKKFNLEESGYEYCVITHAEPGGGLYWVTDTSENSYSTPIPEDWLQKITEIELLLYY